MGQSAYPNNVTLIRSAGPIRGRWIRLPRTRFCLACLCAPAVILPCPRGFPLVWISPFSLTVSPLDRLATLHYFSVRICNLFYFYTNLLSTICGFSSGALVKVTRIVGEIQSSCGFRAKIPRAPWLLALEGRPESCLEDVSPRGRRVPEPQELLCSTRVARTHGHLVREPLSHHLAM